jgi:light-regulated signal transduction histidine kinase (bacteriophytochrome)
LFDFHYEDGYDVYFNIHTVKAGNEVLVTFTDYTSQKRLQLQLQASVEELKHMNSNLEEFAYAASHDLQEPLRKIHYFSQRLRRSMAYRLSDEEANMFERIENASKRMSMLISDLLVYSQITVKNDAFKTVHLGNIIQQVIGDLETSIIEKKATITTGEMPAIRGDAVQLRQLFQNLISNSLKYSKRDLAPVISITARIVRKESNGPARSYHEIVLKDNGIGFEQEHGERIFKIFHRLHGQNEFPGTGIGLAIVAKVVDHHNGFIRAEGRPGEGSDFIILLPIAEGKL